MTSPKFFAIFFIFFIKFIMINFIKGIIVGIFNIVPGLSGSALLITLGLYDKSINSISNIFKNPKRSFLFLFPIGIGILFGTYIFSNVIYFFLNKYPNETYIVIIFLILSTIPYLIKESTKKGYKNIYLIPFVTAFTIGICLKFIKLRIKTKLSYILIGSILSITTIIPGISTTVTLSIFNLYKLYIKTISSINIYGLIPIFISFIITSFLISKLINYLINNYYGYIYFAILGFSLSSCLLLLNNISSINIISLIIGSISFIFTYLFFKVIR